MYSVSLRPPFHSEKVDFPHNLSEWYIFEVFNLPSEVNGTTLLAFDNFFKKYGDHILTRCGRMGGLVNQVTTVESWYLKKKSVWHAQEQVKLAFMNDLDSTNSYKNYTLDKDFLKAAHFQPVRNLGGKYSLGFDGLAQWVNSIRNERKDLICLESNSVPVTHFYGLDDRTEKRRDAVETAMRVLLRKPECNHVEFSKVRPHRAIMKIADGYLCQKTVQGAYWLAEGPDHNGDCQLSWVSLNPIEEMKLTNLGYTQH